MAATAKKTRPAARGAYRVSAPVHASGRGREVQTRTGWWSSAVSGAGRRARARDWKLERVGRARRVERVGRRLGRKWKRQTVVADPVRRRARLNIPRRRGSTSRFLFLVAKKVGFCFFGVMARYISRRRSSRPGRAAFSRCGATSRACTYWMEWNTWPHVAHPLVDPLCTHVDVVAYSCTSSWCNGYRCTCSLVSQLGYTYFFFEHVRIYVLRH